MNISAFTAVACPEKGLIASLLDQVQGRTHLLHSVPEAGESHRVRSRHGVASLPPLGTVDLSEVHTYGAWSWGSRYLPPFVLYMFEVELVARQIVDHGPIFALAHAGHGINSYGLNLITGAGPVAAYVQHGYGGGYSNPVRDLIDINATYSRLHVLLRAAGEIPTREVRWLIAYSQFRGGTEIIDLTRVRRGEAVDQALETYDSEPEIFEALVARLDLRSLELGGTANVSW